MLSKDDNRLFMINGLSRRLRPFSLKLALHFSWPQAMDIDMDGFVSYTELLGLTPISCLSRMFKLS